MEIAALYPPNGPARAWRQWYSEGQCTLFLPYRTQQQLAQRMSWVANDDLVVVLARRCQARSERVNRSGKGKEETTSRRLSCRALSL